MLTAQNLDQVMSRDCSPIALFVYNRPLHTRRTVEALALNGLAESADLIVFSDAAASPAEEEAVQSVRNFVHAIQGFKSVQVVERASNFGLARSIIEGVTAIISAYGRVIVLEDDLLTSPYFLAYMNDALTLCRREARHACQRLQLPDTFFLGPTSCWGWGTWHRAWCQFEKDSERLLEEMKRDEIRRFTLSGAYDYFDQIRQNQAGRINTGPCSGMPPCFGCRDCPCIRAVPSSAILAMMAAEYIVVSVVRST